MRLYSDETAILHEAPSFIDIRDFVTGENLADRFKSRLSSRQPVVPHLRFPTMSENKGPLDLLAPVPTDDGECRRRVLHDPGREDWVEVRVVLGDSATGQRIVTALFDADDKPGAVSDVVTIAGGPRQMTVSGQVAAGGLLRGTYMGTDSSRTLTDSEIRRVGLVFASMRQRYP